MGVMLNNIKEGGVSLTGQEQPFTHDHFRRSFIRRSKNPVINDKVHTLRALQSTLKVRGRGPMAADTIVFSQRPNGTESTWYFFFLLMENNHL